MRSLKKVIFSFDYCIVTIVQTSICSNSNSTVFTVQCKLLGLCSVVRFYRISILRIALSESLLLINFLLKLTFECKCLLHRCWRSLFSFKVVSDFLTSSSIWMMQIRPLGSNGTTRKGGFWFLGRPEFWCWSRVPRMTCRWLSRISNSRADNLKYIVKLK